METLMSTGINSATKSLQLLKALVDEGLLGEQGSTKKIYQLLTAPQNLSYPSTSNLPTAPLSTSQWPVPLYLN